MDDETLIIYLGLIDLASSVFSNTSLEDAQNIMQPAGDDNGDDPSNRRAKATKQLLAAWLNFASGAIGWNETVNVELEDDTTLSLTFAQLIDQAEDILGDPDATRHDLEFAKDLAEAVNLHDQDNEACDEDGDDVEAEGGDDAEEAEDEDEEGDEDESDNGHKGKGKGRK